MKSEQTNARQQPKKSYVTPKLTIYGDIERITLTRVRGPRRPSSAAKVPGSGDSLTTS
jgi:hypothetical protein